MNLTTNTEIKTIKGWEKYADEHSRENTDWGALQAGRYCRRRCLRLFSEYSTAEDTHTVVVAGRRTAQPHDESENREVSGDIRHI